MELWALPVVPALVSAWLWPRSTAGICWAPVRGPVPKRGSSKYWAEWPAAEGHSSLGFLMGCGRGEGCAGIGEGPEVVHENDPGVQLRN